MAEAICPQMSFYSVSSLFCEAKYIGIRNKYGHNSLTEVVGTISNFAYLICGLASFYASRRADPLVKIQCAFLTILGIGSALYHATGFFGFGQLDGLPMLLMITFLFLSILEDTVIDRLRQKDGTVYSCNAREWASAVSYFLSIAYILYALMQNTISDPRFGFDVLFAVPIFAILVLLWYVFRADAAMRRAAAGGTKQGTRLRVVKSKATTVSDEGVPQRTGPDTVVAIHDEAKGSTSHRSARGNRSARGAGGHAGDTLAPPAAPVLAKTGSGLLRALESRRNPALIPGLEDDAVEMRLVVFRAFSFMLIAYIMRTIDINICGEKMVFVFGHGWWHILSGYAAHCIIAFSSYVRADQFLKVPILRWYPACFLKAGIKMVPIVEWTDDPLLVHQLSQLVYGGERNVKLRPQDIVRDFAHTAPGQSAV